LFELQQTLGDQGSTEVAMMVGLSDIHSAILLKFSKLSQEC
jgi:hypothetical protein